ncbi:MAG: tRNA threonylcarbamoyladenosine dehydratase [Clostridia bacterium]|nr:tRNA threonylcarbamoyladenosine dehydratase [Clostridia bacterium]MBR6702379.1 tRNA threonylcarbamoyladenosine dehydratase [Clostridia bacterium]
MDNRFLRTEMLIGKENLDKLRNSRIAVFGIGGVGGYACEALARCGIGSFLLVDSDTVSETNINRQIIANTSTVGRPKTEVMKERMLEINPEIKIEIRDCFFLPENADTFDLGGFDYIIDAVDTLTAKLTLIEKAKKENTPIICAMGAGNKLDPTAFKVEDIYATQVCPLAKRMRKECRSRGIDSLKVVYSEEEPRKPFGEAARTASAERSPDAPRRDLPGSISFVPPAVGLIIASEVVKDLITLPD